MVWGIGDLALQAQVRERQRITIENYANDPDLLAEHVGMEDNFQAGGYGERQVEELLQNAIDQLTSAGRVELRLADGALYCGNEGNPFDAEGIKAVTGAFLSSKKDEKIGRFGLGFKSVLGVTEQPQIISRTISFGFNEPEARDLLAALAYRPPRVPTLRVPSVLDADAIAAEDPNVADMMTWASTIVKLPLVRSGDRLRKRLTDFDARYLLFPERLEEVAITLDSSAGLVTRSFRRVSGSDPDLVQLQSPDAETAMWRVLHRDHRVSAIVAASLPGLFHREQVRVSYALPVGQSRREDGEFWAWFPLSDRTTAQGLFNAPWQVNDDRTSLLPGSALNHELLEIAAELLIDAALLESTAADPAKHFDILPARGRESRSNADSYMSGRVPQLARKHELIPTASGAMKSPSMVRVPFVREAEGKVSFGLPADAVRRWNETVPSGDTPHWSCYSTATRAARLRQLLTDEDDRPLCKLLSPVGWLSELAAIRTEEAIDSALSVYLRLLEEKEEMRNQFTGALIIPLEDGSMVRAGDGPSVLLPVDGADAPDGVKLVETRFAEDLAIRQKLGSLGVREISPDQTVAAAAASVHQNWSDDDWSQFWRLLSQASMAAGRAALEGLIGRKIDVKVPTKAGSWRSSGAVFLDPASVPGLPGRQPDVGAVQGRSDLLAAAGCLEDLRIDYPVYSEESFRKWVEAMQKEADAAVAKDYGRGVKGKLRVGEYSGIGPVDILLELGESKDPAARERRAFWTSRVLRLLPSNSVNVRLDFSTAAPKSADMKAPELWAAEAFGLLDTTLGPMKISKVLASTLEAYGEMLPVARQSLSGIFPLPADLARAPESALALFWEREDYAISDGDRLGELLAVAAARKEFANVREVPALDLKSGTIMLTPLANVVIATLEDLDDLGPHGLRFIPSGGGDEVLIREWGLQRAIDVVAKSIDWTSAEEAVALIDMYPTLAQSLDELPDDVLVRRCTSIVRRTASSLGVKEQPLLLHVDGNTVLVDAQLDLVEVLLKVSSGLRLNLTRDDAETVVGRDKELGKSNLVQHVLAEPSEQGKLLMLVGRHQLAENLPHGLLEIIEERQGPLADREVAELFFSTYGYDALRRLKEALGTAWRKPPRAWDGTPEIELYVTSLGFPRAYGGIREQKVAPVELVPGKVELSPLHDFQRALREQIRELVLIRDKDGEHRRGLLYLPTGAGKTRVTTESITAMLRDEELGSPVLWIAQSEELCEQAITSWAEVWRAIGDERALEITRYREGYEADESLQELQVVIATDAKLAAMIARGSQGYRWLQDAKLVVIDEAHRAGSPRYTAILRWLGITRDAGGSRTERPLLGLTATPYRGTNEEVNKQFVARFGERRLNALDEEDPIGQLRDMKVLSSVEHQLLDGIIVSDSPTEGVAGGKSWDDISRTILAKLGDNLDRTRQLVDHIMGQDPDWPILVFTPSVVSAHVTAALLRSLGRSAEAVDGEMRGQERRRKIDAFKAGDTKVLVNCDLLTQGFDAPKVRALYIARPTFSPNRYVQMVGRGLRGPLNGGTADCLVVNMVDTFTQFDKDLAYNEFDYLWTKKGTGAK